MKYFGPHVSAQGGVSFAPQNAHDIGATAFALFTKNQRQWQAPPLKDSEIASFKANCQKFGYAPHQILAHDSYLINLGQPDPEKRKKSLDAFIDEMTRCQQLGLDRLNFHPGSHLKLIHMDACLQRIAEGIMKALNETEGVAAVIENTAGQGSNVGFELEQIARIIEYTKADSRVKVCIDTCHSFAAGYDLKSEAGYKEFWKKFESLFGYERLGGIHLNDAMKPLGSKVDRHAPLGDGQLGWESFERIAADPNLDEVPIILETPEPDRWAEEIAHLKKFTGQ